MSSTPDQQYLIDTKTLDSPEQCCLTLGGDIIDTGDGTMLCSWAEVDSPLGVDISEIPLSYACNLAQEVAEEEPSAGGQNGGGFGNWLGDNLTNLTEGFADVWGALNPPTTPPTPTYTPPTGGGGAPPPENENNTKTILVIVGVVLVLILGVYLLKRKK